MFNSKILVFNSTQLTLNGFATNWNSTGYDQVYEKIGKFTLNCLTNSVMMSTGQCKDKNSHLILNMI